MDSEPSDDSAYDTRPMEEGFLPVGSDPVGKALGSTTPPEHIENDRRVTKALDTMPDPVTQVRMFDNVITGKRESVEDYQRDTFAPRPGSALDSINQPLSFTLSPFGLLGRAAAAATGLGGIGGMLLGSLSMMAGNKISEKMGHSSVTVSPDGVTVNNSSGDDSVTDNRDDSGSGNRNVYTTEDTTNLPVGLMAGNDPAHPGRYDPLGPTHEDTSPEIPDNIDFGPDSPPPIVRDKFPKSKVSLLAPKQSEILEEEVDPLAMTRRRYAGQNSLLSSGYRGFT
jgi:hypothetical protein